MSAIRIIARFNGKLGVFSFEVDQIRWNAIDPDRPIAPDAVPDRLESIEIMSNTGAGLRHVFDPPDRG